MRPCGIQRTNRCSEYNQQQQKVYLLIFIITKFRYSKQIVEAHLLRLRNSVIYPMLNVCHHNFLVNVIEKIMEVTIIKFQRLVF